MSNVGEISIKVTARTGDFERGMDKVQKETGKTGKQIRKQINDWGKWAGAIAAAAATASAAIVQSSLSSIRELRNVSNAANMTVAEFQRGAFAAQQFGIEQEKYGDILKDVNDRIGDFLSTGAGPMKDFFDEIAPRVGVTIEQFKGLSGQQALGLYIQSLQKANLSQEEMTFFMEAIASDSTRLIPLFQDGAKALNEQTKAARDLGIGLDSISVEKAIKAQQAIDAITGMLKNETFQVVADLSPAITMIADEFLKAKKSADGFDTTLNGVVPIAKGLAKVVSVMAIGAKTIEVAFKHVAFAIAAVATEAAKLGKAIMEKMVVPIRKFLEVAAQIPGIGDKFQGALDSMDSFEKQMDSGIAKSQEWALSLANIAEESGVELIKLNEQFGLDAIDAFFEKARQKIIEGRKSLSNDGNEDGDTGNGNTGNGDTGDGELSTPAIKTNDIGTLKENMQLETDAILLMLEERFMSKEALEAAHLQRELEQLKEAREKKLITEEEFAKQTTETQEKMHRLSAEITAGGMNKLLSVMAQKSKKAAAIQKVMNLAQAGMSIATGIARAQELGFPANIAEMARVAAVGAQAISSIKSASKGSASIPTGGASSAATASAPAPQQPQQQVNKNFMINLTGQSGFTSEQVRQLIGQIGEEVGNGVSFEVTGG